MLICTIATCDDKWMLHADVWLRCARKSNPNAELGLILIGGDKRHEVAAKFDKVVEFGAEHANRPFFNSVRMYATELFGVAECCYVDCDADIVKPLDPVPEESGKDLLFCRSPWMHKPWADLSTQLGYGNPDFSANNGFLYLRRSFEEDYERARERIKEVSDPSRIGGVLATNVMVRMIADECAMLPDCVSMIFDDYTVQDGQILLEHALVVQYVNDRGQQLREQREIERRRAEY